MLAKVTIGAINGGLFNYAGKAVSEAELDSIIEELKTKGIMKGKNNLNGTLSEVLENDYSKYDSTFKVVNGELVYKFEYSNEIIGVIIILFGVIGILGTGIVGNIVRSFAIKQLNFLGKNIPF